MGTLLLSRQGSGHPIAIRHFRHPANGNTASDCIEALTCDVYFQVFSIEERWLPTTIDASIRQDQ